MDPVGRILWATDAPLVGLSVAESGSQGLGSSLSQARRAGSVVTTHETDPPGIMGAFPVQMRGRQHGFLPEATGWLLIHYDLTARQRQLRKELAWSVGLYAAVLSLLCIGLWLFFRHTLLDRVRSLTAAAKSIAQGDFAAEPEVEGGDEIAELADDFRRMAGALKRHSEQLGYLSRHDPLTGLLNRPGFEAALQSFAFSARHGHASGALCHLDIDSFRVINDTEGREAGDQLLVATARLLAERLPDEAIIGRVGADDFALILPLARGRALNEKAQEVQDALEDFRFEWHGTSFKVRLNIGAVALDESTPDAERALAAADAACDAAGESPHQSFRIWWPGETTLERHHGQMRWVSRIQSALDEGRFALWAQQIQPARRHDRGLHLEILVRMLDPRGTPVEPGRFLPAAERYRLIGQIDRWVVRSTFDFLAQHPELLERLSLCAINLSGMSIDDPSMLGAIAQGLEMTGGLPPDRLCFEITETAAVTHLDTASRFIERLRSIGCRFALDDFGSGVSSFGYLKGLDVDLIKIDGLFVRGVAADPTDRAIVGAINEIAHETGKRTIAEFVESDAVLRVVREIGVDFVQGHAIGRAAPLDRFFARLANAM
ncbi:MAG: EAL domain-containing protein [Thermoanaerobaculia bacterium]